MSQSSEASKILLEEYKKNGVVVARGLISAETIESALKEATRLASNTKCSVYDKGMFWKKRKDTVFLEKFEPVIDRSEVFLQLSQNDELILLIGRILSDAYPRLLKDKLIYKSPGQDGYPLHQDYNWWHAYPSHEICTAVIPLEASDTLNGGIEFYLGCHDAVYLPQGHNRAFTPEEKEGLREKDSVVFDLQPGDVLLFHSLTPHFSGRNMSNVGRTQFYPTYCSSRVGDVYHEQLRNHQARSNAINDSNIYEG